MTAPVRTAILISGRGSNMDALIRASKTPHFPADIKLVISNRPNAGGLDRAKAHKVPALCIDHKDYTSRRAFETDVNTKLVNAGIDIICCAGFMRVLSPYFVSRWQGRLMNIHPSLLPKYKGLHTHARVLAAGDRYHGCSVHWVTEELDGGDVILQDRLKIKADDTAENLAQRLLPLELALYPKALAKVARAYQHKAGN